MAISNTIKITGSKLVKWSGLIKYLKERSTRGFTILTYHRVLKYDKGVCPYFRSEMAMSSDNFEKQLQFLHENANVRPLRDLLVALRNKERFSPGTVAVTFDDGYIDNYMHAFPLMKKYKIPATIFLTTGPINDHGVLWWDKVSHVISTLWAKGAFEAVNDSPFGRFIPCNESYERNDLINEIVDRLNDLSVHARDDFWQSLDHWLKVQGIQGPEPLMMTWEMVKEMAGHGISFESHTVNHRFLNELSHEELEKETIPSRDSIRQSVDQPADIIAYPRGRVLSPSKDSFIRENFSAACSVVAGFNDHTVDTYQLRRMDANYFLVDGEFHHEYFEASLYGIWDMIRKLARGFS